MKITKVIIRKIEIPMISSFTTSFGTVSNKPTVIVEVLTDKGYRGWGESAALPYPYYKPETTETCMLVLKEYIIPLVLNKNFKTVEEIMRGLSQVKNHRFAKTSLETASWMIFSLMTQKPLKKILGGIKNKIPVGESIGIKKS